MMTLNTATSRRRIITEIRKELRSLDSWVRVADDDIDDIFFINNNAWGTLTTREFIHANLTNIHALAAQLDEHYETGEST